MKKSVPMITVSTDTLIRECSLGNISKQELYQRIADGVYANHIHDVFGYRRFQYDFCDHMTCYNDGESIVGEFHPSYYDFLYNILHTLGINTKDRVVVDDFKLTEEMLEKVRSLGNISNERELAKEFPMLYRDLVYGRGYLVAAREADKNTEEGKRAIEKEKYCYQCGLRHNFNRFIQEQMKVYTRFIMRRKEYKDSVDKASYNRFMKEHFDMDKVVFYVVSKYVSLCEQTDDIDTIQKYLKLVDLYKNSTYDKNVMIHDGGEVIDWPSLRIRIMKVKEKLPQKNALAVEWQLVPEGYKTVMKGSKNASRETLLNTEELQNLRVAGENKEAFYANTPYVEKVVGLLKYKGYVAYIYENGEILLDRQYNSLVPRTAKGNAIYRIQAKDFEELSGHTKTFLQNDERVERTIHSSKWEDRIQKIVSHEGTEESREDSKKLIKKLRDKNEKTSS